MTECLEKISPCLVTRWSLDTDGGIIAVPKHFPGHPDNLTDSHEALPEANISEVEFDEYASI